MKKSKQSTPFLFLTSHISVWELYRHGNYDKFIPFPFHRTKKREMATPQAKQDPSSMFDSPAEFLHQESLEHNIHVSLFTQVFTAIASGASCGILGVTGTQGVLFYLVSLLFTFSILSYKLSMEPIRYFPSTTTFISHSLFQSLLSFILFWTLLYNIVHVY